MYFEFVLSKISEYFGNIFIIHQDDDYTEEYEDGYEDDTVEEDTDLTNMPDDEYLNTVFSDIDEEWFI